MLLVRVRIAVGLMTLMASILVGGISVNHAGASTSGLLASAPGVTKTTIKIGILTDLTGSDASSFSDSPGAIEARFKQINAEGGIDGRKITWVVDDTTSTAVGAETAAKDLVQNQEMCIRDSGRAGQGPRSPTAVPRRHRRTCCSGRDRGCAP